jgi:hypothetical protein
VLGFTDVMQQSHAENAVDGVIGQSDVECRCLQRPYPFHHVSRLRRIAVLIIDSELSAPMITGWAFPPATARNALHRTAGPEPAPARRPAPAPCGPTARPASGTTDDQDRPDACANILGMLVVVLFGKIELDRSAIMGLLID